MQTSEGSPPASPEKQSKAAPGSTDTPVWHKLLAALGLFLLLLIIGLFLLLLGSLFVVYATGFAARRFGLPELPVTLVFLGLLALVVVGYLGARIGAEIATARKQLGGAIEEAGERVANEVNASTIDVTSALDELPAVVVEPAIIPRGGGLPGKKPPSRGRR